MQSLGVGRAGSPYSNRQGRSFAEGSFLGRTRGVVEDGLNGGALDVQYAMSTRESGAASSSQSKTESPSTVVAKEEEAGGCIWMPLDRLHVKGHAALALSLPSFLLSLNLPLMLQTSHTKDFFVSMRCPRSPSCEPVKLSLTMNCGRLFSLALLVVWRELPRAGQPGKSGICHTFRKIPMFAATTKLNWWTKHLSTLN